MVGALIERLKNHYGLGRVDAVVTRSISAALGVSWKDSLRRSAVSNFIYTNKWLRAFGWLIDGVAYRSTSLGHPIGDLLDWFRADRLWKDLYENGGVENCVVDGIFVGDLIHDSYLRFRPAMIFYANNTFARRVIWQIFRDIRRARQYFKKYRPSIYISSACGAYVEHGIAVRVALNEGVKVWCFQAPPNFAKEVTLDDLYLTNNFLHYRENFEKLNDKETRFDLARQLLEYRLSGGIDFSSAYMQTSNHLSDLNHDLSKFRGSAIIFLHVFSDAVHVFPEIVFHDFWTWVCFTIETLRKANIPFFLKLHPYESDRMQKVIIEKLQEKYGTLDWVPPKTTNKALVNAGISCGITVYGTVAHELAYLGVPTICSARHPHSSFDFCKTARTREEYGDFLKDIPNFYFDKSEMQRQALAFLYMHSHLYDAAEKLDFHKTYLKYLRVCNASDSTEEAVSQVLSELAGHPQFDAFARELVPLYRSDFNGHRRT